MTGPRISLTLEASSTEGIHELIVALERTIEDMKGGHEWMNKDADPGIPDSLTYQWKINTHTDHEHGN